MRRIGPWFARIQPRLQAGKYIDALTSDLVKRNGWSIAEHVGDRTPDRCQRLLNRAVWDTFAVMGEVARFTVEGLDQAARGKGLRIGALDETGQQKQGQATAGVKRQHMGCAGRVDNGINTVHLSYGREKTGHALIGARQWIPAEQISDPARSKTMGLPADLAFRTKGQLAIDILTDAYAGGTVLDFVCGDEVYGNCTELRRFLEDRQQGYVLRVPANFHLTLPSGSSLTCAQAVQRLVTRKRQWEVRSAGPGSKGARWYAWAWIATANPRHSLLIRRHLKTGKLAFHYCYVPEGQISAKTILIRAAGLRWPVEEDLCATRRPAVSPMQWGETRREVSGSDGLPGAERLRGQEHARKPVTMSRRMEWCAGTTRVIWRKLDCLKPNLQEMQLPIHRKDA